MNQTFFWIAVATPKNRCRRTISTQLNVMAQRLHHHRATLTTKLWLFQKEFPSQLILDHTWATMNTLCTIWTKHASAMCSEWIWTVAEIIAVIWIWKFKDKVNFIDVYLYTFNGISINLISFLSQPLEELTHSYSIVTNIIVVLGCICLL